MKSPSWLGDNFRILRGAVTMGLVWTPAWIALFFGLLGLIIVVIRPGPDSDVGSLRMTLIIGWVGFCSGALFGFLVALAERGRAIAMVSLGRAVTWGVLASAAHPLLTGRANQVFWTCPFGALIAAGVVTVARWRAPARTRALTALESGNDDHDSPSGKF